MKDFPAQLDGSLGPWYQKVNAAVDRAKKAATTDELHAILGEPDTTEVVPLDDRRIDEHSPIDPRYPAHIWEYADPCRRGRFYRFDISESGSVLGLTRLTRKG